MVITVTGSTGTIGSEVVRLLSDRRSPTRAVFRDTRRLRALPNVAWVHADLRQVTVHGLDVVAMIERHRVSVLALPSREADRAARGRSYRCAALGANVHARVELPFARPRRLSVSGLP